jgi:putative sterol carrier protein
MTDPINEFFQKIADQTHQPLLGKVRGTVRFDLVESQGGADQWLIAIDRGDVAVAHADGSADCTIRADKAFFERLINGEGNALAAVLRGTIVCSGDIELLFAIQRIFPGPPRLRQASGQRGVSQ